MSFGKGSLQMVATLMNGYGLKFTIAGYYTPNGRSIQKEGIVPDSFLKCIEDKNKNNLYAPVNTGNLYSDNQVDRALKILRRSYSGSIPEMMIIAKKIHAEQQKEPAPSPQVAASSVSAPITNETAPFSLRSYHALVVGNNDYRHLPKLHTAINDARSIAHMLQNKYGFKTRLLLNATRSDILRVINEYRKALTSHDNLLIYYAGHGWLDQEADEGYWLPVDAEKQDPTNWVSNGSITGALRAMEARHVLVIADSCYSGKLARGVHISIRTKNYYQKIYRKKARTVMASGGLEPVADDGGKMGHSIFSSALIDALNENSGILDATLLFSKIRRSVMVNSDQTPEYSDIRKAGHDGGDFLFVREK
jgi:hypothetical protein